MWAGLVLFALLAALALMPARVEAHANYADSDPAANSALETAPERVTIRFTEPLEEALSEIQVLDSLGRRVDNQDSAVDTSDSKLMSVTIDSLDIGTYTVAWKNVSTVDGHLVRGAFVFSVGEPISGVSQTAIADQPLFQSPLEPLVRWLVLLGGLALVGVMGFKLIVSGPVLRGSACPGTGSRLDSVLRPALETASVRLVCAAFGVFLAGSVAQLVVQASVVFESSLLGTVVGPLWDILFETDWGGLWLWRMLLAIGSASVAVGAWRWRNDALTTSAAVGLGAGALLTISLTSHAAATIDVNTEAVINDFIHLIAAAVWVGGLFGLAEFVRLTLNLAGPADRRRILSAVARRFSFVAGVSVFTIVLTGIYSAWAQVVVPAALDVPYGRALIVKVTVVCALLLIAAANLVWVRPRLRAAEGAAAWLKRLVTLEAVLAALVLLSVGFLTALEPARQVASRQGIGSAGALSFQDTVEDANLTLEIDPGLVGQNTISVYLSDPSGDAITNVTDVRVRLSYLEADLGETPFSATDLGAGEFALERQLVSIAGAWQAEVVVQRPDAFDARTAFRFEVSGGSGGSLAIAPEVTTGRSLLGVELGILGLLFMGISIPIGGWYSRSGAMAMVAGVVGVVAGAALLFNVLGSGDRTPVRNPIPPTQDSVAAGRLLYQENCQTCHGSEGLGDGPAGIGLEPPPANLIVHVPLHPDQVLFDFIKEGIPGTAMAAMAAKLTDDDIWRLINYIQTLE